MYGHSNRVAFWLVVTVLLTGCATTSHIREQDRADLRKVSIIPAEHLPVVDIRGIPDDRASTAAEGAVSGALVGGLWAWGIAAGVCVGSLGTACVPAVGAAAGGTVAGGMIGGSAAAESATDTQGYEQQAAAAEGQVQRLNIQVALAEGLDRAARQAGRVDLVPRAHSEIQVISGVDEVVIDELGNLRIIGRLQLLGLDDTPQTHDFDFLLLDAKKPADWVLEEGIAIDHALRRALPAIANRLVDEVAALDADVPALILAAEPDTTAGSPGRWRLGWKTEDDPPAGAQIQLRLYEPGSEPPCIDWLRREHYGSPSVCLPGDPAADRVNESTHEFQTGAAEIKAPSEGAWIARQVWQSTDGQRVSDWVQGPTLSIRNVVPTDRDETRLATIKVKPKVQYRVLWGNRVDCRLYEPELKSTHTAMNKTLEREVRPGRQVIGGVCSRDHVDPITAVMMGGSTPWTENEVAFWLEGDLKSDHRYRIKVAELKSNLSFRCVVLVDRESDEELDRFCIPAPEDEEPGNPRPTGRRSSTRW